MRLILAVYDALRSFDRPATRLELERESGLCKDDVHAGLRGLVRRGSVVKDVDGRRGGTYRLQPDAARPCDLRGNFPRGPEYRATLRAAYLRSVAGAVGADQRPLAEIPAPAPGRARLVVKGVLDLKAKRVEREAAPCALAEFWRGR